MHREAWVSDTSNRKVRQIKQSFHASLMEQQKDSRINYYDFLLVAKKLSFRFEESSHLMALKNFFSKNKNSILIKKLEDALAINQESLNSKDDKIIVKFNVPSNDFAPIKEVTNQDEEQYYDNDEDSGQSKKYNTIDDNFDHNENSEEVNEKMAIILSIKLQEMQSKLKLLTDTFHYPNIFTVFDSYPQEQISFQKFKSGIIEVISDIRDKVKMSEDDIKTLFYILNEKERNFIRLDDIQKMKNLEDLNEPMKQFYYARINKSMVKNTLFKLGKVKSSSIQIYQLKNASVLEFQQIQDSIVNEPIPKGTIKKRIPHFGPLKRANQLKKHDRHYSSTDIKQISVSQNKKGTQLDKEREKIEKILRSSKESKKRQKNGDTVASKLRSLFIHKVILPREKMLESEKQKYGRGKSTGNQLSIRPVRDGH